MLDLVQRLRSMCGNDPNTICTQAADEIERLREQIGAYQLHERQLLAAKMGLECEVESLRSTINQFHHAIKDAGWHPGRTDDLLTDIIRAKGVELAQLQDQDTKLFTPLDIQPPNDAGETMCLVRWMAETPSGWVGAYDKAALEQMSITGEKNEIT